MAYYIPTTFFSKYTVNDIAIKWHGRNGIVGVIPVFNNLDALKCRHPGSGYIEVNELLGST